MSGIHLKLSYKQLQTTKHALQCHMQRSAITSSELDSEQALLAKIEENINMMKEMYKISSNDQKNHQPKAR